MAERRSDWKEARTTGERLRWAVHEHQQPVGKQKGVGLLISKLNARDDAGEGKSGDPLFPGATYPTISGYFDDDPTAPLDFLRAASEELHVNLPWLALGDGFPTPEEAEAAEAATAAVEAQGPSPVDAAIMECFGEGVVPTGRAVLLHSYNRVSQVPGGGRDFDLRMFTEIVAATLKAIQAKRSAPLSTLALDDYLVRFAPVVAQYLGDQFRAGRLQSIDEEETDHA